MNYPARLQNGAEANLSAWTPLRQHERLTVADHQIETGVRAYHLGDEPPVVTHFLARSLPGGP